MYIRILFTALIAGMLVVGAAPSAWGSAQLDALINPNNSESPFEIKYQRSAFIEYEDGGQIADALRGTSGSIAFTLSDGDPEVENLKGLINQNIRFAQSPTSIKELNVDYLVTLSGNQELTSIDYKIVLTGTLQDYIIVEGQGAGRSTIDIGWRDLTADGPVSMQGGEINLPISAIDQLAPDVAAAIQGEARDLLERPLIDATQIHNQPIATWHFLFDATGINEDARQFGLSDEIAGFVVSKFTMGESSIREGIKIEREFEATFTHDREYTVRTLESSDSASLSVIGFALGGSLDDTEILGVTPEPPEGASIKPTGDFPVFIIYGMAGLAAVGGGAFFLFSNRTLKKVANMGQQGIDPSRLIAYQTSSSAGGYQTNRAEAQLRDSDGYQKHRSVYDEAQDSQKDDDDAPQSTKGAMPKGW